MGGGAFAVDEPIHRFTSITLMENIKQKTTTIHGLAVICNEVQVGN